MMEMEWEGDFVQVGLDRYVKKTPGKKLLIWTTLSIITEQFILYQCTIDSICLEIDFIKVQKLPEF